MPKPRPPERNIRTLRRIRRKDGKVHEKYEAYVSAGRHPTTKKTQNVSRTFDTVTEAREWVTQQKALKIGGERLTTTKQTLAEYLEGWLKDHAEQVRDATIYGYKGTLTRWVLNPPRGVPLIGAMRLRELGPQAFNALYRYMARRGIHREVRYLHGVLGLALRAAVKAEILRRNPAAQATLPKRNRKGEGQQTGPVRALTREQADRFLVAAREDRLSAYWHVQLTGGLRPGETCALKWSDVDFAAGEVHVQHTLTRAGVDRAEHQEGWQLTDPKTPKSLRTVPLPELTMRELKKWKARQAAERLRLGAEWTDRGDFVFTTEVGSPLDLANLHRGSFKRVMERAGLGTYGEEPKKPRSGPTAKRPFVPAFRIYDLRHTCASLLLMDGEDILIVSRRLGHSTIKLTADTYAHVSRERGAEAAARFDKMFGTG